MARKNSVVMTTAEKKVVATTLKAEIKALKARGKANGVALKEADKTYMAADKAYVAAKKLIDKEATLVATLINNAEAKLTLLFPPVQAAEVTE